MKTLIEDYIYNVTKRLPEKMRTDIEEELYVTILDMIDGNLEDENQVKSVLTELGSPKVLALKYKDKPESLISSLYYETYLLYLKFSLAVGGILGFLIGSLIYILYSEKAIYEKILKSLCMGTILMFIGFILAFTVVTCVFAVVDRIELTKTQWQLDKMTHKPSHDKLHISKEKSLRRVSISLVLGIIGTILISVGKLGIKDSSGIFYPVFNKQLTPVFITLFILCLIAGLMTSYAKIKTGTWNLTTTILSTVYMVMMTICTIAFLAQPNLIPEGFIITLAHKFSFDETLFQNIFSGFIISSSIVLALIAALLIGKRWYLIIKYK